MFQYHCLNPIAEKGLGLFDEEYKKSEDLQECDAVLVRSAKMHDMELPESVKVIARAGAGVNNIPVKDCAEKGVVVFNTPGANANGVKELVLAGMLLASRDIVGGIEWVAKEKDQEDIDKLAEKQKKQFAGCEIMGKKLGIIGLGAIGAMVANAASALGMEVYGYDPYISIDAAWNLSRTIKHIKSLDEIYSQCDYITIHVPLLDSTKQMINKEAVKQRLNREDQGISFTEFSYNLLQGYDFACLNKQYGVVLQIGGSDQWGNITSGIDLTRRLHQNQVFGLTVPLITKADGTKFGKTEGGAVWLDPKKTSPYKFYQFWLNVSDEDAERYIKIFTMLDKETIDSLIAAHREAPHLRELQKRLAKEITCMIHSEEEYDKAVEASGILFGNATADALRKIDEQTFLQVFEGVPQFEVPAAALSTSAPSRLRSSRRKARPAN